MSTPSPEWPDTSPPKGFRGVFINLDRAVDRRQEIEQEILKFQLEDVYIRLPATDGRLLNQQQKFSPFAEGCFRSHAAAANLARSADAPIHIIEDDTKLSTHVTRFFSHARESELFEKFDVIFLDMWVQPDLEHIERWEKLYRQALTQSKSIPSSFHVQDMREFPCKAASSYAVSPRGAQKLYDCLTAELDRGPSTPVDVYIGRLALEGRLSVGIVVPFLTSVDRNAGSTSSIQLRLPRGVIQSLLLIREAFFIDADVHTEIIPTLDVAIEATRNKVFIGLRQLLSSRPPG